MLPAALGLSLMAFLGMVLGALVTLRRGSLHGWMAVASGVILGTVFAHLIPDAYEMGPAGMAVGLTLGFASLFALEQFTLVHACAEPGDECPVHILSPLALAGFALHNFFDGTVIAASLEASLSTGFVAALSITLHNVPMGISIAALIASSQMAQWKTPLLAAIAAMTPAGTVVSLFGLLLASQVTHAFLLGLSAGILLYVGAGDILPRLHERRDLRVVALFYGGLLVTLLLR